MRAFLVLLIDRFLVFVYRLIAREVVETVKEHKEKALDKKNAEKYQEAINNDLSKEEQIKRAEDLLNGTDSSSK